jgi:uncharacterized membrane protein
MKTLIARPIAVIASLFISGTIIAQTDTYTFLYKDGFPTFAPERTNNHGVTVGAFAFGGILFKDGGYTLFPLPGNNIQTPQVVDINDHGHIVGEYFTPNGVGFLLKNGVITILQVPGAGRTVPHGLNNHDVIVGSYRVGSQLQPTLGFVYKEGVFTSVVVPGATFVSMMDINDSGAAVGQATFQSGGVDTIVAFIYQDGTMTPLPNHPDADRTHYSSINKRGDLVGQIVKFSPVQVQTGFILRDGVFETFSIPGASVFSPSGITDKGDVTGRYLTDDGQGTGFIRRAK